MNEMKKKMKILVACEESQEVCKAFRAKGHEAFSCDILPCSGGHPEWHIKGDIFDVLQEDWDMMIAHPPCTYLTNSGVRWLYNKDKSINIARWFELFESVKFFEALQNANIPLICIENPIPHKYAKFKIGKYTQLIQPWQFGHGETKATCLWLKGLKPLQPTNVVEGREQNIWNMKDKNGKKLSWSSAEIKIARSKTFPGIAKAMADQWG